MDAGDIIYIVVFGIIALFNVLKKSKKTAAKPQNSEEQNPWDEVLQEELKTERQEVEEDFQSAPSSEETEPIEVAISETKPQKQPAATITEETNEKEQPTTYTAQDLRQAVITAEILKRKF